MRAALLVWSGLLLASCHDSLECGTAEFVTVVSGELLSDGPDHPFAAADPVAMTIQREARLVVLEYVDADGRDVEITYAVLPQLRQLDGPLASPL